MLEFMGSIAQVVRASVCDTEEFGSSPNIPTNFEKENKYGTWSNDDSCRSLENNMHCTCLNRQPIDSLGDCEFCEIARNDPASFYAYGDWKYNDLG